jgi:hypothetical protein
MQTIELDRPVADGPRTYRAAAIVRRPSVRDRIAAERWAREAFGDDPGHDALFAGLLGQVAVFYVDGAAEGQRLPPDAIVDADYGTFMQLVRAMTGGGAGGPFSAETTALSAASSPDSAPTGTDRASPSST